MRALVYPTTTVANPVQLAPSLMQTPASSWTAKPSFFGRSIESMHCGDVRLQSPRWQLHAAVAATGEVEMEVRVCTNKSCLKDGSLNVLQYFQDMAPPTLAVEPCGCLGRCGAGPNAVLLPQELLLGHLETPSHVAKLLERQCGAGDPETNLRAAALKNEAKAAFEKNQPEKAEEIFTQAIDLRPIGGLHLLYSNRAAVRTVRGNFAGAFEDAKSAALLAPRWAVPHMHEGEAHMAAGEAELAIAAYTRAAQLDPSLRKSKSYQRKLNEARGKLALIK